MEIATSLTQGFALCSPKGTILGHSYRSTEAATIAAVFENEEHRDEYWEAAKAEGWSVQFVYARIFPPSFFVTKIEAAEEVAA